MGALVAIGACLVVIKGSTDTEDVLLNIAGMLMPVVAFVPTPYEAACSSTPVRAARVNENVTNNVFALLVMGAVALLVAAYFKRQRAGGDGAQGLRLGHRRECGGLPGGRRDVRRGPGRSSSRWPTTAPRSRCSAASWPSRVINARLFGLGPDPTRRTRPWLNRYALVAEGMVASIVLGAAAYLVFGWEHWLFAVESALIALFAWFWVLQTRQLWSTGFWERGPTP